LFRIGAICRQAIFDGNIGAKMDGRGIDRLVDLCRQVSGFGGLVTLWWIDGSGGLVASGEWVALWWIDGSGGLVALWVSGCLSGWIGGSLGGLVALWWIDELIE
jgi:hypothetical protein